MNRKLQIPQETVIDRLEEGHEDHIMGNQRQTTKLTNGLQLHDSWRKKQSVTTTKKKE